jgi:molybdate transport system permease protein
MNERPTSDRVVAPDRASLAIGSLLAFLLVAPLVGLVVSARPSDLWAALASPSVWNALEISLVTTCLTALLTLVLGTPLAWSLARSEHRAAPAIELVLRLPIVLPPSVAGVALLLAFGRRGPFAGWLYPEGTTLAFTGLAVVLAQTFVAAPLYVQGAIAAFRRIDARVLLVARSLGASPTRLLLRVAMPMIAPALIAAIAMCWARALGEFGATLLFAGNMEGRTQTLPLAIYTAFESDLAVARATSIVLVLVALVVLVVVRVLERRSEARA